MEEQEIISSTNKGGRPTLKEKPLGRASNTMVARKLGNIAPEAMDLIIAAMRDNKQPMKERTKNAQWIVNTMMSSLKEVDRQELQRYTIEKLKKENGGKEPEAQEEENGGFEFTPYLVK